MPRLLGGRIERAKPLLHEHAKAISQEVEGRLTHLDHSWGRTG